MLLQVIWFMDNVCQCQSENNIIFVSDGTLKTNYSTVSPHKWDDPLTFVCICGKEPINSTEVAHIISKDQYISNLKEKLDTDACLPDFPGLL